MTKFEPKLCLSDANIQKRIVQLTDCLKLSDEQIINVHKTFLSEMKKGLSDSKALREQSSLSMVNTFVPGMDSIAKHQLDGDYLSLDLGATNFRVLHNILEHEKGDSFRVCYYELPHELRQNNVVFNLFDFMAECITNFIKHHCQELASKIDLNNNQKVQATLPLGFTFSFPTHQHAINIGQIKGWTKNFDLPDAIGCDATQLLQHSLNRIGNQYNIQVVAILNDATGTMVKGAYADPTCIAGVILGTGSNVCYLEDIQNVSKWSTRDPCFRDIHSVLINTECGALGDNGCLDSIKTHFDSKLDFQTLFPGSFTFEKYFSGHFLGELCRIVLESLAENCLISTSDSFQKSLRRYGSISTKDISIIDNAKNQTQKFEMITSLLEKLGNSTPNGDDTKIVNYIIDIITNRASQLIACTLATFIIHSNRSDKSTIAIDGSLYQNHKHLQVLIQYYIENILILLDSKNGHPNRRRAFELVITEDGSGKGAGIVAALATKLNLAKGSFTF